MTQLADGTNGKGCIPPGIRESWYSDHPWSARPIIRNPSCHTKPYVVPVVGIDSWLFVRGPYDQSSIAVISQKLKVRFGSNNSSTSESRS